MTTIYLIRHAEAEGNLYRRCHGHYNSLTTANGYRQIEGLEKRFESIHVDAVYSSDLFRTMATAGAVYRPKGLPLHTHPGLREVGCGVWEDQSWGDLDRFDGEQLDLFNTTDLRWHIEGGETFPAVRARMDRTLREIAAAHDGETVCCFSHAMAIRTVLTLYLGMDYAELPLCDNTAVNTLIFDGDKVTVAGVDDASHVPAELCTAYIRAQNRQKQGGRAIRLWFRPLDFSTEAGIYEECRRDAWVTIHKTMDLYDGEKFLRDARSHSDYDPNSVMVAMDEDRMAGLIQMDYRKDADQGRGGIPFCYLKPEYRAKGIGVQLLGQAVSSYRKLGRSWLRLRCAPDNAAAQHFYQKYGFRKVGNAQDSAVPLDLLDMYIGYEGSWKNGLYSK